MGEDWDGSGENRGCGGASVGSAGERLAPILAANEERREAAAFGGAPVVQRCSGDVSEEERWWRRYFAEGSGERESGRVFWCYVKR